MEMKESEYTLPSGKKFKMRMPKHDKDVEKFCSMSGFQDCGRCLRSDCGDNTNPKVKHEKDNYFAAGSGPVVEPGN